MQDMNNMYICIIYTYTYYIYTLYTHHTHHTTLYSSYFREESPRRHPRKTISEHQHMLTVFQTIWRFRKNMKKWGGYPQSSSNLKGCSTINHPALGVPPFADSCGQDTADELAPGFCIPLRRWEANLPSVIIEPKLVGNGTSEQLYCL